MSIVQFISYHIRDIIVIEWKFFFLLSLLTLNETGKKKIIQFITIYDDGSSLFFFLTIKCYDKWMNDEKKKLSEILNISNLFRFHITFSSFFPEVSRFFSFHISTVVKHHGIIFFRCLENWIMILIHMHTYTMCSRCC